MPLGLDLHSHGVHRSDEEASRLLCLQDEHILAARDDLVELDLRCAKLGVEQVKLFFNIDVVAQLQR